ncbi:MAG: PQQ-dependent sugar dehydrogenase, partial [Planctomycetota bacterium]
MKASLAATVVALTLVGDLAPAQSSVSLEVVADGLSFPMWAGSPRGDDRIFVIEKDSGLIKIVRDGSVLETPFLDLSDKVYPISHSGMQSMAFHPNFEQNGQVFVYYTVDPDVEDNATIARLERFTVSDDPDVVDPTSGLVILEQLHFNPIHKGAGPAFGPDGLLYFAMGQGGAPDCTELELDNWFGKILRLDVDSATPYAIPADNPLIDVPGALPEIAHIGLRNPWRWSIDQETGAIYIGDVGNEVREEVHVIPGGELGWNLGWPVMEGVTCFLGDACGVEYPACFSPEIDAPEFDYGHMGQSRAVVGGYVYRGCALPELVGSYLFCDYESRQFWSMTWSENEGVLGTQEVTQQIDPNGTLFLPVSFGEDGNGEILIVTYLGTVYRIVPTTPAPGIADCNRNGLDDVCEISAGTLADLNFDGIPDDCGPLSSDIPSLSVSLGGAQGLELAAPGLAGKSYVFLGSSSGTAPGVDLGGAFVALGLPDVYFDFLLSDLSNGPLTDGFGVLDANGRASATFALPPGSPRRASQA